MHYHCPIQTTSSSSFLPFNQTNWSSTRYPDLKSSHAKQTLKSSPLVKYIFTFSYQFIPIQLAGIQALRNDKSLGENLLKKLQPLQSIQKPHNAYSLRAGRKKTLPVEKLNRDLLTPKKVTHLFYCWHLFGWLHLATDFRNTSYEIRLLVKYIP